MYIKNCHKVFKPHFSPFFSSFLCRLWCSGLLLCPLWSHGFAQNGEILGGSTNSLWHFRFPVCLPFLRCTVDRHARLCKAHISGHVWLNMSGHVWTCLNLSGLVWTCLHMSVLKQKRFKKIALIWSNHLLWPSVKIRIICEKVYLRQ